MARLRVGVAQLSNDVCTADNMLSQEENIVDGQTRVGQYMCTECTVEPGQCKGVDCAGSDAIV